MDKGKIIEGGIWLSGFSISIIVSAVCLFAGFHNIEYGSSTLLVIGILFLPLIFFFGYKGLKLILDAIFEK